MNSRRDFLQKMGLSALAIPILHTNHLLPSGWLDPTHLPKPLDGPILRVAIMGLGGYGGRVAEAMLECKRAKLTGLISGTPDRSNG